jgi:hypothetical protein
MFFDDDLLSVVCSRCSKQINMQVVNTVKYWVNHWLTELCVKHKRGSAPSSTPSIERFGFLVKSSELRHSRPICKGVETPQMIEVLCPGLRGSDDFRITRYLQRSAALGGGAPPRYTLCARLFGKSVHLGLLDEDERVELMREERASWLWENSHGTLSMFSRQCLKMVQMTEEDAERFAPSPCASCRDLLNVKTFCNILSRPVPEAENVKFTPHSTNSPLIRNIVKRQLGVEDLLTTVSLTISQAITETQLILILALSQEKVCTGSSSPKWLLPESSNPTPSSLESLNITSSAGVG